MIGIWVGGVYFEGKWVMGALQTTSQARSSGPPHASVYPANQPRPAYDAGATIGLFFGQCLSVFVRVPNLRVSKYNLRD